MSESGAYLTAFSTMFAIDALQHALVGIDLGHVGRQLHAHPARRDAVQCAGDDLVPAQGMEQGIDRIGRDPGHVQQVADQHVEPVRTFLDRGQQFLFLLRGVVDVGLPEAADGELDPGQRRPQVVGDCAEDGGAHGVALGQAHHLPPAGHQLLAFQLGGQMHTERRRGAAGRWPAGSVRRGPAAWRRRSPRRCRRSGIVRRRAGRCRAGISPARRPEAATSPADARRCQASARRSPG